MSNQITVIAAFVIQPSETLGGQAEQLIDLARSDQYEDLLRKELGLPDAPVRLFPEGQWEMSSIGTQEDLDNKEVFSRFVGHAAVALDNLGVSYEVVNAFTTSQFEVISLPTSGRVILFQPITASKSQLGRLIEPTDSGNKDNHLESTDGGKYDSLDSKIQAGHLEDLNAAKRAASVALEGLRLDRNDARSVAALAAASARYLVLYPGKAVDDEMNRAMNRAWNSSVEEFMLDTGRYFSSGLDLTMNDPRSSIERLTIKLCFVVFKETELKKNDLDALRHMDEVIDMLERTRELNIRFQTGEATPAETIEQLRVMNIDKRHDVERGQCFIATVVYGSPEAAEVELLREFRDRCLARFQLGRIFIHCYYKLGPSIASSISQRRNLTRAIKMLLDIVVYFISFQLGRPAKAWVSTKRLTRGRKL